MEASATCCRRVKYWKPLEDYYEISVVHTNTKLDPLWPPSLYFMFIVTWNQRIVKWFVLEGNSKDHLVQTYTTKSKCGDALHLREVYGFLSKLVCVTYGGDFYNRKFFISVPFVCIECLLLIFPNCPEQTNKKNTTKSSTRGLWCLAVEFGGARGLVACGIRRKNCNFLR